MIIRTKAYARAGLIGNPSDGYYGKTISFIIRNFEAEVGLYETPELEILPAARDHSIFGSIEELRRDVGFFGYYGGVRLLKATVKRFYDYCLENGIEVGGPQFHHSLPQRMCRRRWAWRDRAPSSPPRSRR